MATEYAFDIASDLKTVQALELLSRHISGLTLTWNGKNSDYLVGSTISINVSEPFRSWQETIVEGFGFTPTLLVGFRFHTNTDFAAFSEIMFQATMLLLEHAQDAVLLFNYEIIVLQRLSGKLVFVDELDGVQPPAAPGPVHGALAAPAQLRLQVVAAHGGAHEGQQRRLGLRLPQLPLPPPAPPDPGASHGLFPGNLIHQRNLRGGAA